MSSKEKSECSALKDPGDHLFVVPKLVNKVRQSKPNNNTTTSSIGTATTTISTVTNIPRKSCCKRKSKFSSLPPLMSETYGDPQEKRICPDTRLEAAPKSDNTGFDAAKARAEAINAKLKACGKLSTETSIKPKPVVTSSQGGPSLLSVLQISHITKVNEQMYAAKIDINDLPSALRTNLTQLSVQESLRNVAKSSVLVKGQHLTSVEKKGLDVIDKQLHFLIQALTKERVAKTIASVKELILNSNSPKPAVSGGIKPVMMNGNLLSLPALPMGSYVQEKVFVGMDNSPPEFDLKRKLLGENYEHFNYIANRNGSKVILRGRGSGFLEPTSGREAFESMYIFISHFQQAGVNASKKLVMDLIENVRSSLSAYMSQFSTPSVGYYPYGGGSYSAPTPANYHQPPQIPTDPTNTKCPGPVPPPPTPMSVYPPPLTSSGSGVDNNMLDNSLVTSTTSSNHGAEEVSTKSSKQRRRFQEKVPDYTGILGYKHNEHNGSVEHKKSKQSFCDGETNKEKEEVKIENNNKISENQPTDDGSGSGLPFWMSMD